MSDDISLMSDQPKPSPDADSQPADVSDAGCQKRLHADGGPENGTAADAVSAAEPLPEHEDDAEPHCEFGEPEPPQKRVKVDPDSELDIRFLICSKVSCPVHCHQSLISASHPDQYKSTVTIPDCPGPERVLSIGTRLDVLPDLLKEITLLMDDNPQRQSQPDKDVELRLLIHTSHAGGIIGRGGQRIKELREQTKAAIKVFSQCCPQSTERVVAVQGPVLTVIHAIRVVLDVIVATNIKGTVKLFDPFNYDAFAAAEYGGYGDPALATGRSAGGRQPVSAQRMGLDAGRSAGWDWNRQRPAPASYLIDRRDMHLSQAASYRWPAPADTRHRSLPAGMAENVPYWSDNISPESNAALPPQWAWQMSQQPAVAVADPADLIQNPDGSASATLTVPNNVAGAIIGKGGSRIRVVRKDSGAEISIENGSGSGSDRKVVVKGNANQVRMAYTMLQQSIAEHSH